VRRTHKAVDVKPPGDHYYRRLGSRAWEWWRSEVGPNIRVTIALIAGAAVLAGALRLTGLFGSTVWSAGLSAVLGALIAAVVVALGLGVIAILRAPSMLHRELALELDTLNAKQVSLTNELRLWGPPGREGELKRLVVARFAEFPLRQREIESLFGAVKWSLENPLGHLFTAHDAMDVPSKPKESVDEQQRFHLPLPAYIPEYPMNPTIQGDIDSDEDLYTLGQIRRTLLRLIEEARRNEDYWAGRNDVKR
jgi:hypothetical protein